MKLMVAVLLLAAACQAEVARSKQDSRTERRAEGSTVDKRAPAILPTVPPSASPGIEYADSKDSQTEKTPTQSHVTNGERKTEITAQLSSFRRKSSGTSIVCKEMALHLCTELEVDLQPHNSDGLPVCIKIYVRPVSQVAKISDVLTGQGPAFPIAIASHLFSPVPVYQPRLSSPTTYEISAPVQSQLAYSEHKIGYQPQQNAIQYSSQEYNQKIPNPKQAIARLTVNYQPYPQQLLVQPQPLVYQQQPQQIQQFPVYQPQGFQQQIQYNQPQIFPQNQAAYNQQPLVQLVQAQPGVTYARQEENKEEQSHQRPAQRELKTGQPEAVKEQESRVLPQQIYNAQPGGVSFASFSQGPPGPSYPQIQYQTQQQQQQQQHQQQQQQQQQQYQQLQYQQQYQPIQYQPQPQIQYQQPLQYQVPQYQPAPQRQITSKPEQNLIAVPVKPQRLYFKQGIPQQIQQQLYQPQYQGQEAPGYQANFPPIQYFGKFAQSIFGQYQQPQ